MKMGVARKVSEGATRDWLRRLGENLRRVRNEQDIPLKELAARADVDDTVLSRAERGLTSAEGLRRRGRAEGLRVGVLRKIAVALAVPLSDLLPEEE